MPTTSSAPFSCANQARNEATIAATRRSRVSSRFASATVTRPAAGRADVRLGRATLSRVAAQPNARVAICDGCPNAGKNPTKAKYAPRHHIRPLPTPGNSQVPYSFLRDSVLVDIAGTSLLHGWVNPAVQVVAIIALLGVIRWRQPAWCARWLSLGVAVGVTASVMLYGILTSRGLMPDSAPWTFWVWLTLTIVTVVALFGGWIRASWVRRTVALCASVLAVACLALAANQWAGFYPTPARAWQALTAQPLPDQVSLQSLSHLRGATEPRGKVVPIRIADDISHFHHRTEYVYLPPAWFAGPTPPHLAAIVMIGGVVTTTEDWARSGGALATDQSYAAAHHGYAPILVFVDPTGGLTNDTECVDGPHGKVDTHMTREVRPYVVSRFGAAADPQQWAVAGWSMGGTCAIDLTVEHPDLFHTFLDISGDAGPNLGDRNQTIKTLYGGRADLWTHYDPASAMSDHGPYDDLAGWFEDEGHRSGRSGTLTSPQIHAAQTLDRAARRDGITTILRPESGRHCWPFAAHGFRQALPWLADRLEPSTLLN